jgi:hypothetical protein
MNRYLVQYIHQKNLWRPHFKKTVIDPTNISPREARELLDSLDNDLSPENLCCDGELRGAPLRAKAKMLNEAKRALESGNY